MVLHLGNGQGEVLLMLAGAVGALYGASRVAGVALDRHEGSDPGRRAVAQWIPIAGATLAAILFGRADIALSLIFSTSIGFLLLVMGIITLITPLQTLPHSRNVWQYLFPVALLILMAGLSGHLTWWHAVMMLALGVAILAVWLQPPTLRPDTQETPSTGKLVLDYAPAAIPAPRRRAVVLAVVVLGLTLIGSILAVQGTLTLCAQQLGQNRMVYPGTFAALIVSPLMVIPTLGTASSIAQRGQAGNAVTSIIGSVFLNLCLLLPIAVLLWHLDPSQWSGSAGQFYNIRWYGDHWLPFDLAAWQIETVCLVAIGFGLVPVALGRWTIGPVESALMIVAYGAYVVMLVLFGVRQI